MSDYKYKSPVESGYTKFKLTKKQHNGIFKNRQIRWFDKYEYYYNDKAVILHKFSNWKVVLLSTVLFPILVLLGGILNIRDIWKELVGLYNQKEVGSFISEMTWRESKHYQQMIEIIKK